MQMFTSIDPDVLVTVKRLYFGDINSFLQLFSHLPIKNSAESPYPKVLRLILSSHCEQRCQYPDEGILWCHNEGIMRDGFPMSRLERTLTAARYFLEWHGLRAVKIGGLELVPGAGLNYLVQELQKMGYTDLSFTTHGRNMNGRLMALRESGLTRMTVSIQNFEQAGYLRLTGRDGLSAAIRLVEEAQAVGLTPLKVNRVLLKGYTEDITSFLEWIRINGLTARLFDLMWQPGHDRYYLKYLISWKEFLPLWLDFTENITIQHYPLAQRVRLSFHLRGGGCIEVNLPQSKPASTSDVCHECPLGNVCMEGYLGCGIRVVPDLNLSPCILRPDLERNLISYLEAGQPEIISEALRGAKPVNAKPYHPFPVLGIDAKPREQGSA